MLCMFEWGPGGDAAAAGLRRRPGRYCPHPPHGQEGPPAHELRQQVRQAPHQGAGDARPSGKAKQRTDCVKRETFIEPLIFGIVIKQLLYRVDFQAVTWPINRSINQSINRTARSIFVHAWSTTYGSFKFVKKHRSKPILEKEDYFMYQFQKCFFTLHREVKLQSLRKESSLFYLSLSCLR